MTTITRVPGFDGEATDLLEHRPGKVPERRLDDVERDPHTASSTHDSWIRLASSGIELEVHGPRLRGLERLGVVHRALRRVVHGSRRRRARRSAPGSGAGPASGSARPGDDDGDVGHHDVGLPQQAGLQPNELGPADEVAEQRRLHHLGYHHVDEVIGRGSPHGRRRSRSASSRFVPSKLAAARGRAISTRERPPPLLQVVRHIPVRLLHRMHDPELARTDRPDRRPGAAAVAASRSRTTSTMWLIPSPPDRTALRRSCRITTR